VERLCYAAVYVCMWIEYYCYASVTKGVNSHLPAGENQYTLYVHYRIKIITEDSSTVCCHCDMILLYMSVEWSRDSSQSSHCRSVKCPSLSKPAAAAVQQHTSLPAGLWGGCSADERTTSAENSCDATFTCALTGLHAATARLTHRCPATQIW